jgi:hypothetical protein
VSLMYGLNATTTHILNHCQYTNGVSTEPICHLVYRVVEARGGGIHDTFLSGRGSLKARYTISQENSI